jgi:hypothetical protein
MLNKHVNQLSLRKCLGLNKINRLYFAATVEICESNGAGETVTHNITNTNMGSTDAANLNAVNNPITPGNRSYIKYQRFHVTAMGGSSKIDNLKVWRTGSLAGSTTHVTNARTSSYGGALTYATPVATAVTGVDQTMPTSTPGSANLGIGGALNGSLTATGFSDYLGHQLVTDSGDISGNTTTMNYQYDETA